MKAIIKKIKNMDKEHFSGLMGENIQDNGMEVNNMEQGSTYCQQEKVEKGNGWMEKEVIGLMNEYFIIFLIICLIYFKCKKRKNVDAQSKV